ncbi:hypothetical protein GGR54DRAFT_405998 [Hypoxylon sp. NC1633]|nr:hypothetical protein GGR54DRAFT_405998 [Hypoxylon sp. NC1633]
MLVVSSAAPRNRRKRNRLHDEPEELESPRSEGGGLDWDLVAKLDQDPEGKSYFPPLFDEDARAPYEPYATDNKVVPDILTDPECQVYTAWCLDRIKNMRVSNIVASMLDDPNLKVRWCLPLRSYYKEQQLFLRELQLNSSPLSNHEAAYASMVGVVLSPEMACEYCKKQNGTFRCCIVVPGRLNGACTCCHYNSGGSKCTHRANAVKRVKIGGVSNTRPVAPRSPSPSRSIHGSSVPSVPLSYQLESIERDIDLIKAKLTNLKAEAIAKERRLRR